MTMLQESKKQLVGLVFTILTVAAISITAKLMDEPDTLKTLKMKAARQVQVFSDRGALAFVNLADRADAVYKSEQP